jgi:predicted TIM-barrel fold metal-dependent hydrolase
MIDKRAGNAREGAAELLPDPEPRPVWCPLISADDHVLEPEWLFHRIDPRFADRAPAFDVGSGRGVWIIEDAQVPIHGSNAAVGRPVRQWNRGEMSLDEFRPGTHDVDARIADMDLNGVYASLNFPSIVWGFAGSRFSYMKDPELGLACLRAYNDWMVEDWWGAYPDRFIPCQLPWLADPEVAAQEIRANAARGFRAVSFSENPETLGFSSIHTRHWDPFFAACEDTGTVLNLHIGSSGNVPRPSSDTPSPAIAALFPVNGVLALVDWVFSKIPARFPELKIVMSEAGVSWVPTAIERLDRAYRQREAGGHWTADDCHPVELLHRNFWYTSIEDPSAFRLLDLIGEDKVMVETDYPHNDSSWPDSQALIRGELEDLEPRVIAKICFENAATLYRHPPPPASVLEQSEIGATLVGRPRSSH